MPGVYLFALEGQVVYVGAAKMSVLRRLDDYIGRFSDPPSGRRDRPVHLALRKCRNESRAVATYCLGLGTRSVVSDGSDDVVLWHATWNQLPVRLVAGLDYCLIDTLRPPWNRHGAAEVRVAQFDRQRLS